MVSESLPTVLLLLRFQADPQLTGPGSRVNEIEPTALYLAVQERHASIGFALLNAGASVKDAHNYEDLPRLLVSACDWGECSVIRRLIEAGAELQISRAGRRRMGITHTSAVHAAISRGHHDVVKTLISCGLDLTTAISDAKVSDGSNDSDSSDDLEGSDKPDDPLTFAVSQEKTAIIPTLLQHLPRGSDTMLLQASKAAIEHNLVTTLVQLLDAAWNAKSVPILVDLSRIACRTPHESVFELLFDHLSTLDDEP